ncbi:hypothetical protein HC725_14675 [Vibrio sp. S17_S38]|uniref:DUF6701 domain-containing protein n=1 Tax=Vibrio sp. S17_S38 TaxID=2720229 RepID=UPI0016806D03|nr:DUF6701 domain-containing protein [Vibrio sp. S17_S38]MBD1574505.1 hypothetical protein [Vibrio sp. S17_S38]
MRSRFCLILLLLISFYSKADIDYCQYFTEPVQSWGNDGEINLLSPDIFLEGWSEGYQNKYLSNGVLQVPFNKTRDTNSLYQLTNDSCVTSEGNSDCALRSGQTPPPLAPVPANLNPVWGTESLTLDQYNYTTVCGSSSACQYVENGNKVLIYISDNLKSLKVSSYGNLSLNVIFKPKAGEYGVSVQSYYTDGAVQTLFLGNSAYTFDSFVLNGAGASLVYQKKVRINIVTTYNQTNNIVMNDIDDAKDLIIYGPTADLTFRITDSDLYAYILAKSVTFTNKAIVYGGITTNQLEMNVSGSRVIGGEGACSVPADNTYRIDVSPDNQFALLCQAPKITYTVYNEDGTVATDYNGTITASYPSGLIPLDPTVGSKNSNYVYKPTNGVVTVPVKADTIKEYSISAKLTDDSSATDSGNILFGPYKFDVEQVKAVAGHPTQFSVQVLACKDDKVTSVKGYSGDKELTVSNINLTKPTTAQGAQDGGLQVSDSENGSYSNNSVKLNFNVDAKSSAYLKYAESGSLNFMLADPKFVCPADYDGCDITPDGDGTDGGDGTDSDSFSTLQGLVNVDVRPWTFAICKPKDKYGNAYDATGNSDVGEKFIPAGEAFSLQVKPIVWKAGDPDPITVKDIGKMTSPDEYCNNDPTSNFFVPGALAWTVVLDGKLETPEEGRSVIKLESLSSLNRLNTEKAQGDYFLYDDLSWQEVGSLNISVDNTPEYLGMEINHNYREVGRFYPHHFKLENDNQWNYAAGHNGFAYMNQPIKVGYRVKAKNATDSDTENYGYFSQKFLASFTIEGIKRENIFGSMVDGDSLDNRFIFGSAPTDYHWDKATYEFSVTDFTFLKDLINSSPYTSSPDGPYNNDNSVFGISVNTLNKTPYTNNDNINFDDDFVDTSIFTADNGLDKVGVSFFEQPDFRYGRMTLDSVSGPIGGPISVPLRVEYWDGSGFITNPNDSGSKFTPNVYYVMSDIASSSAKLTGPETIVNNGKSSVIKAEQTNSQRETVRLFLRQGNDSGGYGNSARPEDDPDFNVTMTGWSNPHDIGQPWLQFNWRNLGDEDPSTVVIFGAYRGNDRIIYRGEPNLTAN